MPSSSRLHGLDDDGVVTRSKNPDVIDQGVFHNDVIAVGNQNVFFHEQAFYQKDADEELAGKFGVEANRFTFIEVPTAEVSVQDAVKTYLFNTQIITLPGGDMTIIAPTECEENEAVKRYLDKLVTLGHAY